MKIAPLGAVDCFRGHCVFAKGWLYFWHVQGVEWLGNKSKAATVSQVHVFKFLRKHDENSEFLFSNLPFRTIIQNQI